MNSNFDKNFAPQLLLGLENLYKDRIFVDTTLVIGKTEISVHRCVISAVSGYFRSMFAGSLKEAFQHERVELKELDENVVSNLIEYCYTGRITIDEQNVMRLLETSNLLQFDTVRNMCSDFLINQLSPGNCIEMSEMAHDAGMWDLKENSELFLLENVGRVAQVQKDFFTIGLNQFEGILKNPRLLVPKEETIIELIQGWILHDEANRSHLVPHLIKYVRLPFVRRFYLLQISHYSYLAEKCASLIAEAKLFHEMKIDIADYAREERFRPRLSTGVHEIFVRIGGTNTELDELSVVEGYNPITKAWRRLSEPLGEPLRGGYSTCALGPDLYICGGRSSDGLVSNKCFRFRPQLDSWSQINGMLMDREYHTSASLGGYLYCISSDTAERFDPVSEAWCLIEPMPLTCENLQAIGAKGILYVVGSPQTEDGPGNITLFEFDPSTGRWTHNEIDPLEIWSVCPLMTSLNGILYFLGDDSRNLQSFNPIKKNWTLLPQSNEVHLGGSLTILDGKITISGGYASESGLTDTIEQYDIEHGNWSVYARLKEPTFWHGSVSVHKFINPPNSPDFKCESN